MSVIEKTAEQAPASGARLVDPEHSPVELRAKRMVMDLIAVRVGR